jgi:hypothetical protein
MTFFELTNFYQKTEFFSEHYLTGRLAKNFNYKNRINLFQKRVRDTIKGKCHQKIFMIVSYFFWNFITERIEKTRIFINFLFVLRIKKLLKFGIQTNLRKMTEFFARKWWQIEFLSIFFSQTRYHFCFWPENSMFKFILGKF